MALYLRCTGQYAISVSKCRNLVNQLEEKMKSNFYLCILLLLIGFTAPLLAQEGTIIDRTTADPEKSGYARWIKLTFQTTPGGTNNLNDNFNGVKFMIDLNLDRDDNATTHTPGEVYAIRGDSIKTHYNSAGGQFDPYLYLPIRGNHDTNIRPRVKLETTGSLRIGAFQLTIQNDTGYETCRDGIKPNLRMAIYYDDGSGSSGPESQSPGNTTAFDGYIDRIDIIWSEPMDTTNKAVSGDILNGLGDTILRTQTTGEWYDDENPLTYDYQRFTFYVISNTPNTGISITLTYQPPVSSLDKFKAKFPYDGVNRYEAESNSVTVQDKAGPAIISAKTVRAHGKRRQPLADALAGKRVLVTFSEKVNRANLLLDDLTFTVTIMGTQQDVYAVRFPTSGYSTTFEIELDDPYSTENDTGSIRYSGSSLVSDINGNLNGISTANEPPTRPAAGYGLLINIWDGILPNIIRVRTRDVALPGELVSGGANGWGVLDYVDIIFDHTMDTGQLSTSGFTVEGDGIQGIAGVGNWFNSTTFRIPIAASNPKMPNTGILPQVKYENPGSPNGMRDNTNYGYTEDVFHSDTTLSNSNYRIVEIIDNAGPAIWRATTASKNSIRITFSEKIRTNFPSSTNWPTNPAHAYTSPKKFIWYVDNVASEDTGTEIFFTGIQPNYQNKIVYLHQTGTTWTKYDSGGINFTGQGVVRDIANNGNDQYDNDTSLGSKTILGSDVKVHRDTIAPNLVAVQTVDTDLNGKIDGYRFVFDDTSAVYPKTSFNIENWSVISYYTLEAKTLLGLDESGYTVVGSDTLSVLLRFEETPDDTLKKRAYLGDTGDVPDIIVATGQGFSDWAGNVMDPLPIGITKEKDKSGPAICSAKTISTQDVDVFISEDLKDSTVSRDDFLLNMVVPLPYPGGTFPIMTATEQTPEMHANPEEIKHGRVTLKVPPQVSWQPDYEGFVSFSQPATVYDHVSDDEGVHPMMDNPNSQIDTIKVDDNAASQFNIHLKIPGNPVSGAPFQIEVIALDSDGELDRNFPYEIFFSSNLPTNDISMPYGPHALDEGVGLFTVTSWVETNNLIFMVSVNNDNYSGYHSQSAPITVEAPVIDAPDTLIVEDYPNDQGGHVILKFDYSDNHPGIGENNLISYYQIYREVNHEVFHWYTQPAVDTTGSYADSMIIVLNTIDNEESNFWVRAVHDRNRSLAKQFVSQTDDRDGYLLAESVNPTMLYSEGKISEAYGTYMETLSTGQYLSATVMSHGRAVDNIPPKMPENLLAAKEGVAVKLMWNKVRLGVNNTPEGKLYYEIYAHNQNAYFNPDEDGELLATIEDTAFTIPDNRLRRFYCIRAFDGDNKSAVSNRVGKYGFALNKSKNSSFNYLSFPLETQDITDAKSVAQLIENLKLVLYKLNPATNSFSTYYIPHIEYGTNFALETGSPLLVNNDKTIADTWFYTGKIPPVGSVKFALNKGEKSIFNEIIVPLDKFDITNADQLAQNIGGIEIVYKLDPETNAFSKFWIPDIGYGENFTIMPGEPVLININQDAPDVWPN